MASPSDPPLRTGPWASLAPVLCSPAPEAEVSHPTRLPAVGVQVMPVTKWLRTLKHGNFWIIKEAVTLLRHHGMSAGRITAELRHAWEFPG